MRLAIEIDDAVVKHIGECILTVLRKRYIEDLTLPERSSDYQPTEDESVDAAIAYIKRRVKEVVGEILNSFPTEEAKVRLTEIKSLKKEIEDLGKVDVTVD